MMFNAFWYFSLSVACKAENNKACLLSPRALLNSVSACKDLTDTLLPVADKYVFMPWLNSYSKTSNSAGNTLSRCFNLISSTMIAPAFLSSNKV